MCCINSDVFNPVKQIDCDVEHVKMVHLINISIYFVIVLLGTEASQSEFDQWEQTAKSKLPILGNKIQSLLIGYFQQNHKSIQSVGVPRFLYSFQQDSIDTTSYDTLSVIEVDCVNFIFEITVFELVPSHFVIGDVQQYPCVQPYQKVSCSCQGDDDQ